MPDCAKELKTLRGAAALVDGPQGTHKGLPRSAKGPTRTPRTPKGRQRPSKGPLVVDFETAKQLSMTRPGEMRGAIK